jgi:hypothetical protein
VRDRIQADKSSKYDQPSGWLVKQSNFPDQREIAIIDPTFFQLLQDQGNAQSQDEVNRKYE